MESSLNAERVLRAELLWNGAEKKEMLSRAGRLPELGRVESMPAMHEGILSRFENI